MPRTIPELSIDAQTIEKFLDTLDPGTIATYEELTRLIGRDVRQDRGPLNTAIRRLVRNQKVFAAVRGVGFKRLSDSEILGLTPSALASMSNKARRTAKKLAAVDYNSLSREQQTQHNTALSVLAVVNYMAKPSNIKKLEQRVGESHAALPVGRTLEAFK